jgi:hypothetical protein
MSVGVVGARGRAFARMDHAISVSIRAKVMARARGEAPPDDPTDDPIGNGDEARSKAEEPGEDDGVHRYSGFCFPLGMSTTKRPTNNAPASQTLPTFLCAPARQKTAATLHSQKRISGTNTQSRSTEDSAQQNMHRLAIPRQKFVISRRVDLLQRISGSRQDVSQCTLKDRKCPDQAEDFCLAPQKPTSALYECTHRAQHRPRCSERGRKPLIYRRKHLRNSPIFFYRSMLAYLPSRGCHGFGLDM